MCFQRRGSRLLATECGTDWAPPHPGVRPGLLFELERGRILGLFIKKKKNSRQCLREGLFFIFPPCLISSFSPFFSFLYPNKVPLALISGLVWLLPLIRGVPDPSLETWWPSWIFSQPHVSIATIPFHYGCINALSYPQWWELFYFCF